MNGSITNNPNLSTDLSKVTLHSTAAVNESGAKSTISVASQHSATPSRSLQAKITNYLTPAFLKGVQDKAADAANNAGADAYTMAPAVAEARTRLLQMKAANTHTPLELAQQHMLLEGLVKSANPHLERTSQLYAHLNANRADGEPELHPSLNDWNPGSESALDNMINRITAQHAQYEKVLETLGPDHADTPTIKAAHAAFRQGVQVQAAQAKLSTLLLQGNIDVIQHMLGELEKLPAGDEEGKRLATDLKGHLALMQAAVKPHKEAAQTFIDKTAIVTHQDFKENLNNMASWNNVGSAVWSAAFSQSIKSMLHFGIMKGVSDFVLGKPDEDWKALLIRAGISAAALSESHIFNNKVLQPLLTFVGERTAKKNLAFTGVPSKLAVPAPAAAVVMPDGTPRLRTEDEMQLQNDVTDTRRKYFDEAKGRAQVGGLVGDLIPYATMGIGHVLARAIPTVAHMAPAQTPEDAANVVASVGDMLLKYPGQKGAASLIGGAGMGGISAIWNARQTVNGVHTHTLQTADPLVAQANVLISARKTACDAAADPEGLKLQVRNMLDVMDLVSVRHTESGDTRSEVAWPSAPPDNTGRKPAMTGSKLWNDTKAGITSAYDPRNPEVWREHGQRWANAAQGAAFQNFYEKYFPEKWLDAGHNDGNLAIFAAQIMGASTIILSGFFPGLAAAEETKAGRKEPAGPKPEALSGTAKGKRKAEDDVESGPAVKKQKETPAKQRMLVESNYFGRVENVGATMRNPQRSGVIHSIPTTAWPADPDAPPLTGTARLTAGAAEGLRMAGALGEATYHELRAVLQFAPAVVASAFGAIPQAIVDASQSRKKRKADAAAEGEKEAKRPAARTSDTPPGSRLGSFSGILSSLGQNNKGPLLPQFERRTSHEDVSSQGEQSTPHTPSLPTLPPLAHLRSDSLESIPLGEELNAAFEKFSENIGMTPLAQPPANPAAHNFFDPRTAFDGGPADAPTPASSRTGTPRSRSPSTTSSTTVDSDMTDLERQLFEPRDEPPVVRPIPELLRRFGSEQGIEGRIMNPPPKES